LAPDRDSIRLAWAPVEMKEPPGYLGKVKYLYRQGGILALLGRVRRHLKFRFSPPSQ